MQLFKVVPKKKVWEYNSGELPQRGRFWEYNLIELPQRKYFENTTPQSCLKGNVLRIKLCRIALKGSMGIQLHKVALKKIFWEYNFTKLPQRKYFEEIQLRRVALTQNVGIQLRRVVLQWIFWEYNSTEFPQRDFCIIRLRKVVLKEIFWEYNSVKLPQWECWNTTPESCPKRTPGENAIPQNFLKENVVGCNIRKCSRKKRFDDIDSRSQFWSWIFNSGLDLIFDSGSIFYFFEFGWWLKVNSWFST